MLAGTIIYHLKQIGTSVASQISNNIYVDNVFLGADSVQDAYEMYLGFKDIFRRASMNLREWISNSLEFLNLLPESETVKGDTVKTFGIPWNYTEDYLQIGGINFTYVDESPTKREVLKVLTKIFDTLGLIIPVTFFGKVFLQDLWKEGTSWDESLPDILCNKWMEILQKLRKTSFGIENTKFCWKCEHLKAV